MVWTLNSDIARQGAIWIGLIVITLSVYVYVLYSEVRYSRMKLRHTREMHEREMANKEAQLSIMRSFLTRQIDIMQKMEAIANRPDLRVALGDGDWREMEVMLESIDNLFVTRLRQQFPALSDSDIRLFMLLRLKMPARSLAMIYGISEKSVKQKLFLYKSKLRLEGKGQSLREFIENF